MCEQEREPPQCRPSDAGRLQGRTKQTSEKTDGEVPDVSGRRVPNCRCVLGCQTCQGAGRASYRRVLRWPRCQATCPEVSDVSGALPTDVS